MNTPYYERTLDSFADSIITRVHRNESRTGWYACLDVGPESYVSDPDFSTYAATRKEAIRLCAEAIRQDAKGIGKYAPHSLLVPGDYDLHFRLMKHWAKKESRRRAK